MDPQEKVTVVTGALPGVRYAAADRPTAGGAALPRADMDAASEEVHHAGT